MARNPPRRSLIRNEAKRNEHEGDDEGRPKEPAARHGDFEIDGGHARKVTGAAVQAVGLSAEVRQPVPVRLVFDAIAGAELMVRVRDTETDHTHAVSIDVLVPMRPDATMSELEEAARTQAKAILEESARLLQESTVAELRDREYSQDDAAAAAADEELQRRISEIGNPSR